jgi:HD-GYP domain-containing protein (c-di-GMP phosphodiesterase class II)
VPSAILTKKTALAEDEIQVVRESMQQSASLLGGIEFSGPVADTLTQAGERVDGGGPLGLKGDHILMTARIIAAANAFVGMISPRSYRPALKIEEATGLLLREIDTQLDRRVVVALINFVENQRGREALVALLKK